jgi:hypothetical protein
MNGINICDRITHRLESVQESQHFVRLFLNADLAIAAFPPLLTTALLKRTGSAVHVIYCSISSDGGRRDLRPYFFPLVFSQQI